jgi:predicted DsbA family dithiol-disulfide isomerase
MTQNEDHITVYSDYVCPFCYLGRRSLEEHQEIRERDLNVDSVQTIRYAWATEDALEKPDFFPVKEALDELEAERDEFGPEDLELVVEYEEEQEQPI